MHYEHILIETKLVPAIQLIKEGDGTPEQKNKAIEEYFEIFLKEAKEYKECPGFKKMSVADLKKEYYSIIKQKSDQEMER